MEESDFYQDIVDKYSSSLKELDRLKNFSEKVLRQLNMEIREENRRAAYILAWLVRLYARKVGEAKVLKEWFK